MELNSQKMYEERGWKIIKHNIIKYKAEKTAVRHDAKNGPFIDEN